MTSATLTQRIESAAIAILVAASFLTLGYDWWWLVSLFLVFDLSALGYLKDPKLGAHLYNIGHSYTLPTLLAGTYLALASSGHRIEPLAVTASAWAFHIAVDRALGFGLKHPDSFQHTHLGPIGKSVAPTP